MAGADRTDSGELLLPVYVDDWAYGDQPTIDPPSSSAGGRAAGAGAEPVGFVPSAAPQMDLRADERQSEVAGGGATVAPGSPSERRDPGANRNSIPVGLCPRGFESIDRK